MLTLGRICKLIPPPWNKGGGWTPPHLLVQYFETILPAEESLCSSLQDEVYFMGGGTAGGPVTSSTMVAILGAILDFTKN